MSLTRLASQQASARSYIRFSPVRAYPQLFIGKSNVENVLSLLWSGVEAGAAVSATLYFAGGSSPSAFYQRSLLSIPNDRCSEYPPIEASWLTEAVQTLWVPGDDAWNMLRPPTFSDKFANESARSDAENAWLQSLASYLTRIHNHSVGGVLVLMTSYASIEIVTGLLAHSWPDIPIVAANGSMPLVQQRSAFMKHVYNGRKPLWLAVGGAWTGLDVGGHDPWRDLFGSSLDASQDNVLTTLVIPRLPFGTNQSITHLWRKQQRPNTPWELYESAFRFKQGLGRLIRRPGLPGNREIYVLDGRLRDPQFLNMASIFQRMLERYPRIQKCSL